MTIRQRRRALMAANSGENLVPNGYVTDGLVFFLDGLQLVSATEWTDIVGKKKFRLNDCTIPSSANGVSFNGTSSYGEYNGTITNDWENETVECAVSGLPLSGTGSCVINQPKIGNDLGISFMAGASANTAKIGIGADGESRSCTQFIRTANKKRFSIRSGLCVINEHAESAKSSTSFVAGTDVTTLGCRATETKSYKFPVTMYAIRIYNRKLTEAEMIQNQQADALRYGL